VLMISGSCVPLKILPMRRAQSTYQNRETFRV